MIGFLKNFPGETVGFYGSGTGFAGIFGSGTLIILKAIGLSDAAIYLIASPTLIPYMFSFWWLDKQKVKYVYIQETESETLKDDVGYNQNSSEAIVNTPNASEDSVPLDLTPNTAHRRVVEKQENANRMSGVADNVPMSFASAKSVVSRTGFLMINLSLVYYFEYLICTGLPIAISG